MASCWSAKDPSSFSCAPSRQEQDKSSFRAHPTVLKEPLAPSSWNARQAMNCTSAQRGGTKAAPSFPGTGGILDQTSLTLSRLIRDFLSIWILRNSWTPWSREMTLSRNLLRPQRREMNSNNSWNNYPWQKTLEAFPFTEVARKKVLIMRRKPKNWTWKSDKRNFQRKKRKNSTE